MEPRIAPLVNRSLSLFEVLSDSVFASQDEYSTTRSHLSRLKLWAGSLGAHRSSGGRSLEYRLRDSSFVRNHIVSLLQELVSFIDEGIQAANTDSGDDMIMNASDDVGMDLNLYFQSDDAHEQSDIMIILGDIGHIIDCLLRLSITIRNPAPHDQFNSRAGAVTVSFYREWDMNHIREKFGHLDSELVNRLGMAMSRRRQYFKYREEHSEKLAHGLLGETDEGDNTTTIASSIPSILKDMDNQASFTEMDTLFDGMSVTSATSYTPSSAATNELRVPNIPKEYVNGPFQCPFCRTIITIDDRSSWKRHVFGDLQPYICLFDNCSAPSQLYRRRKDWVAHMKQEHWVSWSCSFGCSRSYNTQKSFERHITKVHGQTSHYVDLQAIMNLCRFPDDTKIVGTCPLCLDYQIQSVKSYQSHVGDHLERLALFVLPNTAQDDSDEEEHDEDSNHSQEAHGYQYDGLERFELEEEYIPAVEENEASSLAGPMGSGSDGDTIAVRAKMKGLDDISDNFRFKWLPQCLKYIDRPPKEAKQRDKEYRRLSESIMRDIILKLDDIETEGIEEIRWRRKNIVRQVQEVLKQLDIAKAS